MDILDELTSVQSDATAGRRIVSETEEDVSVFGRGRYILWIYLKNKTIKNKFKERLDYIFASSALASDAASIITTYEYDSGAYSGYSFTNVDEIVSVSFDFDAVHVFPVFSLIDRILAAGCEKSRESIYRTNLEFNDGNTLESFIESVYFNVTESAAARPQEPLKDDEKQIFDRNHRAYLGICKQMIKDYYQKSGRLFTFEDDVRIRREVNYRKEWTGYRDYLTKRVRMENGDIVYRLAVTDPIYKKTAAFEIKGSDLHDLYIRFGMFTGVISYFFTTAHPETTILNTPVNEIPTISLPQNYIVEGFNPHALIYKLSRGGCRDYLVDFEKYDFDEAYVEFLREYTEHRKERTHLSTKDNVNLFNDDLSVLEKFINSTEIRKYRKIEEDGYTG